MIMEKNIIQMVKYYLKEHLKMGENTMENFMNILMIRI